MTRSNALGSESVAREQQRQGDLFADEERGLRESPTVRVSRRARRLSLRVYRSGRVEVVAPQGASPRVIERFVAAHREWMRQRQEQALRALPALAPFPPAAIEFTFDGTRWPVHYAVRDGRARLAEHADGLQLSSRGVSGALRPLLRRWLLHAAARTLTPALHSLAAEIGAKPRGVTVRCQRTRWGSCSARGAISLNACLVFQPPDVVRYLMIHELTHLQHMDHSARFWAAVERLEPGWRALDRRLLDGWRSVPGWVFGHE
jgi:predicted metal-dependent hydrolase